MAALTKAGQESNPASTPSSPRERGHGGGCADRGTPGHPSSHNSWTGLGQTTPHHSTLTGCGTGATISRNQGQSSQGTNARHEGTTNRRDPNSLQCFRCQGWGHMARECLTPATALNQSRGIRGNVAHPHWQQPQQPTVGSQHSLSNPRPKLTCMRAAQRMGQQEASPVHFLNPDPIACLVGHSNEVPVIMDGQSDHTD